MQGLFPIIRRKRVPLVVTDSPPVLVGNVEPVPAVAAEPPPVVPLVEPALPDETPTPAPLEAAVRKERRAKRSA